MIVDDDRSMDQTLSFLFQREGFEVAVCEDGESGAEKAISWKPDAVILDLILPKKNGFDVLSDIRKSSDIASTPVFAFTRLGHPDDRQKIKELGVEQYFTKTDITLKALVEEIKSFLQK